MGSLIGILCYCRPLSAVTGSFHIDVKIDEDEIGNIITEGRWYWTSISIKDFKPEAVTCCAWKPSKREELEKQECQELKTYGKCSHGAALYLSICRDYDRHGYERKVDGLETYCVFTKGAGRVFNSVN